MMLDEKNNSDSQTKLIELIIKSNKSTNNSLLQRFYFDLLEIEKCPMALTDLIFNIFSEQQNNKFFSLDELDQKIYLVYINNWLSKLKGLRESKKIVDLENKIYILINILFEDKLFEKNKHLFDEILKNAFSLLSTNKEFQKKVNNEKIEIFINKLLLRMKEQLTNEIHNSNFTISLSRLLSYIILLESLIFFQCEVVKNTSQLEEYNILINIILNVFLVDHSEDTKNKISFLNFLSSSFCRTSIKLFETFKKEEFIKFMSNQIQKVDHHNKEENKFSFFFNSELFFTFINKILKLNHNLKVEEPSSLNALNGLNTLNDSLILLFPNINDISYAINSSKLNIIEMLTIISEYLTDSNIFENFEYLKLYTKDLCLSIIKALGEFNTKKVNDDTFTFIEKTDNREGEIIILKYITRLIEYLIVSVQNSSGSSLFSENTIEIFRYVILPNLLITPLERDLFLIEPEEYVKLISDMTAKQTNRLPKPKTIKLIDNMCEFIDSFLKFITEFCVDTIYYVILKNDNSLPYKMAVLEKEKMSIFYDFFKIVSDENLLDMSFQILCSVSYLIYDRQKLRNFLEDKIEMVNHILLNIQSDMIKSKLCNFYAYTLDDMFHDRETIISKCFDDSFNFLFDLLTKENSNFSLNYMALESIQSLIFDEDMMLIVSDVVKLNIKNVLNLINVPRFKELTNNIAFHKFVKNLIKVFFNEIEGDLIYVFLYFWNDIKVELENHIHKTPKSANKEVLQERNIKLLEQLHNLKNLIVTIRDRSCDIENKKQIYNELLSILNYLNSFLNYDYEEDILEIITIIINDLKLVPASYANHLNLILEAFMNDYSNKIENYHILFVFNFLKNLRKEDLLCYRVKFYWNDLDLSISNTSSTHQEENQHNFINILDILELITRRFELNPISDDILIQNLCFTFFISIVKLDILGKLVHLKNYKNLQILLLKSLTLHNKFESIEENSIASIYASKIIFFLFTNFYDQIQNYANDFQDPTIINIIKHLINFNIDHLLFLRKASSLKKESQNDDLINEIKNKKGKFYKKVVNNIEKKKYTFIEEEFSEKEESEKEDSDVNAFYNKFAEGKKQGRKQIQDEDSESDSGSNQNDLIDDILNDSENSENSENSDDDFLKVKKPSKEFSKYMKTFAPPNLLLELSGINEFKLFDDALNNISNTSVDVYSCFISTFPKRKVDTLESLRKFKKIVTSQSNSEPKFRKIVKIKRK